MKYAPVIIPTLCRYEHFKKCIESLSRCTWAEKTEVYVGLDYPVKESHWGGYNQIKNYLSSCGNLNFKKLHIVERTYNYGIGLNGNFSDLRKSVFQYHDRVICTEDDNVFSPNFLAYMNKGLELYENDDEVIAICGYSHPYGFKFEGNNHFKHNTDFSAWGYGIWKHKYNDAVDWICKSNNYRLLSPKYIIKFKSHGLNRLRDYFKYVNIISVEWITDTLLSVYMIINNKYVIMPQETKVRNEGWDPWGESFKNGMSKRNEELAVVHKSQKVDSESDFDFVGDSNLFIEENNAIAASKSDGKIGLSAFVGAICTCFVKGLVKKMLR